MAWCVSRDDKASDTADRFGDNARMAARQSITEISTEAESSMHAALKHNKHHHRQLAKTVEPDKHIKELMNVVRDQLQQILQRQDQIVQRQDQQFDLLQKSQMRMHQNMETLQHTAREQWQAAREESREQWQSAREELQSVRDQGTPLQPSGLSVNGVNQLVQPSELWTQEAPQRHPQGIDTGEGMKMHSCTLRDPEVLEDTLHDLIGEVREEYAKLKELRKDGQDGPGADERQQQKVIATQMKQMRDSLDRTLVQVSAWAQKAPDSMDPSATPITFHSGVSSQVAQAARSSIGSTSSKRSLFLPMAKHHSRAASAEELDEKMDELLGQEIEKPTEGNCLQRLVKHRFFELFFGTFILLNTVVMAGEMQYSGTVAGSDMGFPDTERPPDWVQDLLDVLDKVFLSIFTIELVLKMAGLRKQFWFSLWNLLDFVIVAFGIIESFGPVDVGLNPMTLRLARLLKLSRFLKMFRMAGHLFVLNLIMKSVSATLSTLFWSMLLLTMIQAVFGMLVGQLVYSFLTDPHGDPATQQAVYRYYGTFTRTMFTMFEITHVNYSRAARILTDNVGETWAWFFVLYRLLVGFAILQVIRAVFIQQTLKVADNDKELRLMTHEKERNNLTRKLNDVFNLLDIEGVDAVGMTEFVVILQIPRMQVWLSALDIDTRDPEMLFRLLDLDGDGSLTRDEFVRGAAKLRGAAQSMDLFSLFDFTTDLTSKVDLLIPDQGTRQVRPTRSSVLAPCNDALKRASLAISGVDNVVVNAAA